MITDILSREHQIVLKQLDKLGRALQPYQEKPVREVLAFFDHEMKLHRRKEEEVLFPEMSVAFPQGGPVQVMLMEHEEERGYIEGIRQGLEKADSALVVRNARAILELLPNHIQKEDGILYPMAQHILQGDAVERVRKGFEAIGTFVPA